MSVLNRVFEVTKDKLNLTQVVSEELILPDDNESILLAIDKFALTANNITYGITGDILGYWQFFPTQQPWGRLPVMGFAQVVRSNHPEIQVGERVWGFFPMAQHLVVKAGNVSANGFQDVAAHRSLLSPVYSRYERVNSNPFYRSETEDHQLLVKGLYTTSWLIDDFFTEQQYCNAKQYIVTSASSKTSIALAFAAKSRSSIPCIGVTSAERVEFVKSLGLYQQVVSYEQIERLDGTVSSIIVDMAGAKSVLNQLYQHFDKKVSYCCRVGATHNSDLYQDEPLHGTKPVMFFAPAQMEKRAKQWGAGKVAMAIAESLNEYITFCQRHIDVVHYQSFAELENIYRQVLLGKASANTGIIVSLVEAR